MPTVSSIAAGGRGNWAGLGTDRRMKRGREWGDGHRDGDGVGDGDGDGDGVGDEVGFRIGEGQVAWEFIFYLSLHGTLLSKQVP